ncbi:hypothetical protein BC937DRAFT_89248 [Endogone sp. FLAS-F59071]|nr:hypothetical protein BC937DRAFT_89248 [Endogone sp. FLAS-F59071]|eukprot:RUS18006.1 hypothetical protein BC937DRAFT_89248 [Endogone sp. FLAS-F59071]
MSNATQRKKPTNVTSDASDASDVDPPRDAVPKAKKASLVYLVFQVLAWGAVLALVSSYLVTETWTWGYKGKYTNLKTYVPAQELVFSEEQLKAYDGTNPDLPIYIAIDGDVFDVSGGRSYYGPVRVDLIMPFFHSLDHASSHHILSFPLLSQGGGYHHFAGRDAARAFVTGCFATHLTHDLRGLSPEELKTVAHWKGFYNDHHKYIKVGTVMHAPIDPASPIPEPCNQASPQKPASS